MVEIKKIDHGEAHEGWVTADYFSDGEVVRAEFHDGDIGSGTRQYSLRCKDTNYFIEIKDSYNRDTSTIPTNVHSKLEAKRIMIDLIVRGIPEEAEPSHSNVSGRELKAALETVLLN